ncbi:chromate transporter [Sediminispirochaeta smaragdinae]|uniref:Chromate transporter n=1 Tax=Sediminispirochaeta smaragdinae (strain DSM 11293 / JCM 15392 / SEBR 4228) TaxID=573413 RepID=E1R411_SEDSS|nr:chromate transporter [Sediminispirochaeta smaragdinae]ADK80433.1 Chromate transporter [Sediminispirochaeta smaragdinae DSM 11293]
MALHFDLLWTFFKIGLFSFGGGYAMIPLMKMEIERHGWLSLQEFADLVAVSQMTPGPIGINAATFIGIRTAGISGAIVSTLGVVLPSFVIIIIIARLLNAFRTNRIVDAVIKGVRPATIGLIATAVLFFAELSIFRGHIGLETIGTWIAGKGGPKLNFALNPGGCIIFVLILILVRRFKLHPILGVILSGILGIFLMG